MAGKLQPVVRHACRICGGYFQAAARAVYCSSSCRATAYKYKQEGLTRGEVLLRLAERLEVESQRLRRHAEQWLNFEDDQRRLCALNVIEKPDFTDWYRSKSGEDEFHTMLPERRETRIDSSWYD